MAQIAIRVGATLAGATIGDLIGGPMGALQGAAIGFQIGNTIASGMASKGQTTTGPRLSDLNIQVSTYGKPIPKVYGTMRLAGNVIWAQPIKEVAPSSSGGGGGKGGTSGKVSQTQSSYTYFATLAIAICEGQIDDILQVWADSELLTDEMLGSGSSNYNIYKGSESQTADPIMESFDGAGNVPSYRGMAYVVLKDFPLANYGNRIPNFTFQVTKNVRTAGALEDKITAVHIIPGAGEFVYDTTIQKRVNTQTSVATAPINMHNSANKSDVQVALDQLQKALPNVTWVSLVVTWFATSTDAGACTIIPKVEVQGNVTTSPDSWSVAGLNRSTAQPVLTFGDGTPTYGGTPSDSTVIHALIELKARGLNVMFYPLIFVDTITPEAKPWRGRITPANATDAASWFTKTDGYDNFINHYLNLSVGGVALKDKIDAFVIGSEYVGMTSATFSTGVYPAVTGFVNLAATAKTALGAGVKTIYAGDWSEYHHAAGGWFNMDPLWASTNLDIVGIDCYMPLTPDLQQPQITYQDVYDGWTKDEGYDYFFDTRPNNAAGTSNLVTNPFTTTSGSAVVSVDLTGFVNHHLIVGQSFTLAGCTGNPGGITNAHINGVRTVLAVTNSTHVTFTAGGTASGSATAGGASCTIDKPKYFSGSAFAWKNISYWWSHTHTNPDASVTDWTAKMKPLWFTEFGFPSVDGCSNQPNVFVDPTSVEGFYPRGSRQRVDFAAQRQALTATIDFLTAQNAISGNANLVPQRFVWTWDARPYPAYPNLTNVWADGILWKTGHWIEGKVGASGLGAIVASLLGEVGITDIDVSGITDNVNGYILNNITTVRDAINVLTAPYFFDMVESGGTLKFIKRGNPSVLTIAQDNLVPLGSSGDMRVAAKMTRMQELDLPRLFSVSYFNALNSYEQNTQIAQRQSGNAINQINLAWNLSLADQEAQNIAQKLLYSAWIARTSYQFMLAPQNATIEPTDVITITIDNVDRRVRITDGEMHQNGAQTITAVAEDVSVYDFYLAPGTGTTTPVTQNVVPVTQMDILDLPAFPHDNPNDSFLTIGAAPLDPNWKGAVVYRSDDGGVAGGNTYSLLASMTTSAVMGVALTTLASGTVFTWDNAHTVDIAMIAGELTSQTALGVLNGANVAILGGEVIQFQTATLISTGTYRLSGLLRGRLGTEDQVAGHGSSEKFVLLDGGVSRLTMSLSRIGLLSYYKCVSVGDTLGNTTEQSLTYTARQLKPYSPVQITGTRDVSLNLTINWVRRTRIGGDLRDNVDIPLNEQSESYQVDILNGSTVVRTISSTSSTCSYSAANQTTDFGSTQSSVSVKVYQISAAVGRGIAGIASV